MYMAPKFNLSRLMWQEDRTDSQISLLTSFMFSGIYYCTQTPKKIDTLKFILDILLSSFPTPVFSNYHTKSVLRNLHSSMPILSQVFFSFICPCCYPFSLLPPQFQHLLQTDSTTIWKELLWFPPLQAQSIHYSVKWHHIVTVDVQHVFH